MSIATARSWEGAVAARSVSDLPDYALPHHAADLLAHALDPWADRASRMLYVASAAASLRVWAGIGERGEPVPPLLRPDLSPEALLWGAMMCIAEAAAAAGGPGEFIDLAESHLRTWYEGELDRHA